MANAGNMQGPALDGMPLATSPMEVDLIVVDAPENPRSLPKTIAAPSPRLRPPVWHAVLPHATVCEPRGDVKPHPI